MEERAGQRGAGSPAEPSWDKCEMRRIKTLFFIVVASWEEAQRTPSEKSALYEQLLRWYNVAYDSFLHVL